MIIVTKFDINETVIKENYEDGEYRGDIIYEVISIHINKDKSISYVVRAKSDGLIYVYHEDEFHSENPLDNALIDHPI